jgi:hypothetical protein
MSVSMNCCGCWLGVWCLCLCLCLPGVDERKEQSRGISSFWGRLAGGMNWHYAGSSSSIVNLSGEEVQARVGSFRPDYYLLSVCIRAQYSSRHILTVRVCSVPCVVLVLPQITY